MAFVFVMAVFPSPRGDEGSATRTERRASIGWQLDSFRPLAGMRAQQHDNKLCDSACFIFNEFPSPREDEGSATRITLDVIAAEGIVSVPSRG